MRKFLANRDARTAFTLVELLVVIAIIALLIGILVPTVSAVRNRARATSSAATIASLETGLATFQGQAQGGSLPPSSSDKLQGPVIGTIANPYRNYQGVPAALQRPTIEVTGANLLYFALAGADGLGCPGFKTFRPNSTTWADDHGVNGQTTPGSAMAYDINPNDQRPVYTRGDVLVDLAKVGVSELNTNPGGFGFEIPIEVLNAKQAGGTPPIRTAPMFLDAFGYPILYWRADTAGRVVAGYSRDARNYDNGAYIPGASAPLRGIYHYADNSQLIEYRPGNLTLLRLTKRDPAQEYFLNWSREVDSPTGQGARVPEFWAYIQDPDLRAKPTPQRADSYLLISPGPDGSYGTADDITNFKPNGR